MAMRISLSGGESDRSESRGSARRSIRGPRRPGNCATAVSSRTREVTGLRRHRRKSPAPTSCGRVSDPARSHQVRSGEVSARPAEKARSPSRRVRWCERMPVASTRLSPARTPMCRGSQGWPTGRGIRSTPAAVGPQKKDRGGIRRAKARHSRSRLVSALARSRVPANGAVRSGPRNRPRASMASRTKKGPVRREGGSGCRGAIERECPGGRAQRANSPQPRRLRP